MLLYNFMCYMSFLSEKELGLSSQEGWFLQAHPLIC